MEAKNYFEKIIVKTLNDIYLSRLYILPFLPMSILPAPIGRYIGIIASMTLGFSMIALGIYLTIRFEAKVNGETDESTTITKEFFKYISIPILLTLFFIIIDTIILGH